MLSGLSLSSSPDILYAVSDNSGNVFKITTTGKRLSTFLTNCTDLEGVAVNLTDNSIWIIEERNRKAIQLNQQGEKLKTISVPVDVYYENNGIEGISINPENEHLFILNEKNPGQLIEIDNKGTLIASKSLFFASDYSGIFINDTGTEMWIISDEASKIFKCNMQAEVIEEYSIGIYDAEGIAVDVINEIIYVVSDSNKKLYLYDLPK